MTSRKEQMEIEIAAQQAEIDIARREADKSYYVGPATVFFTGVALGFTRGGGDTLYAVFLLSLFGGIAWFIIRAMAKQRAEHRYEDEVERGRKLRDEYVRTGGN